MNRSLSRISFEISNFLTANINFWKSLNVLGLPQFTPIFQKYDVEKFFYLCNNQFPWYAKVRENRLFRKCWLKLEYSSSQTLFLSIKSFSSYWLRPHCEKSRKMFLKAIEINPFKPNQQIRRWTTISKLEAARSNQKIFKTTHVRKHNLKTQYTIDKESQYSNLLLSYTL